MAVFRPASSWEVRSSDERIRKLPPTMEAPMIAAAMTMGTPEFCATGSLLRITRSCRARPRWETRIAPIARFFEGRPRGRRGLGWIEWSQPPQRRALPRVHCDRVDAGEVPG